MKQAHKRDAAAQLYAKGIGRRDIADSLQIGLRTLDRWACDPEFHELVEKHRQLIGEALATKWQKLSDEHADNGETLRQITMKRLEQIALDQAMGEPISSIEILNLSAALAKAIEIERRATSMHLREASVAIQEVMKMGYTVHAGATPIDVTAATVS